MPTFNGGVLKQCGVGAQNLIENMNLNKSVNFIRCSKPALLLILCYRGCF